VDLKADIEVPAGYQVTTCSWTGDLPPKEVEPSPANSCHYECTPPTALGPFNMHGEQDVILTVACRHKASGRYGWTSAAGSGFSSRRRVMTTRTACPTGVSTGELMAPSLD